MANGDTVLAAFLAGSIAAGATVLGTLPALFARSLNRRLQDTMLGFGAGIMLAAASFRHTFSRSREGCVGIRYTSNVHADAIERSVYP